MRLEELGSTQRRMLELLRGSRRLEVRQVARLLGVKPSTVRKYALELEKLGLARRIGGALEITEEGVRLLEAGGGGEEAGRGAGVEPLYIVGPEGPELLRVSDVRQLAAAVVYGLASRESIAYMIRSGLLQAWLRNVAGEEELAAELDRLASEPGAEERLAEVLRGLL